jgi:hypothetical protein
MGFASVVAGADVFEVTAEQWARPRSGNRIAAFKSFEKLVNLLDQRTGATITIRYAGGDEGLLWAEELRGWFVSLGIASERIRLRSGLKDRDRLVLETD